MPLVTTPTSSPPARIPFPGRGMPAPSIVNGANLCAGPAARSAAIGSDPMKPVASTQHQPSPASIGLRSGVRSLPWR